MDQREKETGPLPQGGFQSAWGDRTHTQDTHRQGIIIVVVEVTD